MMGFMMNRSNCGKNPYSCDNSIFLEKIDTESGRMIRWIECREEKKDGSFLLIENGMLCTNMPSDWWAEYLKLSCIVSA
jgi:hypothetical protein